MPELNDGPPYDVPQAASRLNLSEDIIRDAARKRRIPAFRVGREWRFPRAKIDALARGEAA